ncbi:MAG TPA: hypothetical protein VD997_17665 [Phycisphaerales bacterium]|nr:hypothetical protein [Phycisphaerales bacterium]
MRSWGIWFIIMGAGSFLLHYINMEFILLSWVDLWGATIGNVIRVGFIALGIVMVALGRPDADAPVQSTRPTDQPPRP